MKWLWFIFCLVVGSVLLFLGMIVPSHFMATDAKVIEAAAARSRSLVDHGTDLLRNEKVGPAKLLLEAAQMEYVPGADTLAASVANFSSTHVTVSAAGGTSWPLGEVLPKVGESLIQTLITEQARKTARKQLSSSRRAAVMELLRTSERTNFSNFAPVSAAAGQPLEAAILATALLVQNDAFLPALQTEVEALAIRADRMHDVALLEQFYLDLLAFGRRMNWGQLVQLSKHVESSTAWHDLADLVRYHDADFPVIYASVLFQGRSEPVTKYLFKWGATGMADMRFALRAGDQATDLLLGRQDRVHYPGLRQTVTKYAGPVAPFLTRGALNNPRVSLGMKYCFVSLGLILIVQSLRSLIPSGVRPGFGIAQFVVAMVLVFVVAAMMEPFLGRQIQAVELPRIQLQMPMLAQDVQRTVTNLTNPMIDPASMIALVAFLVIQGIVYILCLFKLAEIRRQGVPSSVKLKLLENEENLFDAGLYIGLFGTVASLLLLAMGIVKPSLTAAYASTLFGIIFVAILKILHLRPMKRRLILDAERNAE